MPTSAAAAAIAIKPCMRATPIPSGALICRFTLLAARGSDLPIHGDGGSVRSYLYVEDVAEAFDCVLHKGTTGEACEACLPLLDLQAGPQPCMWCDSRPSHCSFYSACA